MSVATVALKVLDERIRPYLPLLVSCWDRRSEPFELKPLERSAQPVPAPAVQARLRVMEKFETTARSQVGFGCSGKH